MLEYCEDSLVLEDQGGTCLSNIRGMCVRLCQERKKKQRCHHVLLIHLLQITSANNLWHNLLNTVFGHTVATLDISPCVCIGPHAYEGVVQPGYNVQG